MPKADRDRRPRVELEVARDRPGDVVRDGGGADAALGADDRDDAADRLGVRRREQSADRAHHVERADRRDQIVADAAPRELAIKQDVVEPADDDDARAGVAHLGKLIEAGRRSSPRLSDSMMMTFGVGAVR